MKKKYDFKKIKIICEFDENVSMVVCEESKIIQVLLNVFKNAAQSIHMAEPIIVSPRLVLRLNTEPEHVVIEIEDNGPGMDEDTRKRIFDPFFTTRDVDQGTGLGLSLSYYIIVDEHQGEMTVSSNPGQGTLFIIKLPVESVE
jgi:signal transduction histidine kinase